MAMFRIIFTFQLNTGKTVKHNSKIDFKWQGGPIFRSYNKQF